MKKRGELQIKEKCKISHTRRVSPEFKAGKPAPKGTQFEYFVSKYEMNLNVIMDEVCRMLYVFIEY